MVQVLSAVKLTKPEGISTKKEIGEQTGLEGSQLRVLASQTEFLAKAKMGGPEK